MELYREERKVKGKGERGEEEVGEEEEKEGKGLRERDTRNGGHYSIGKLNFITKVQRISKEIRKRMYQRQETRVFWLNYPVTLLENWLELFNINQVRLGTLLDTETIQLRGRNSV